MTSQETIRKVRLDNKKGLSNRRIALKRGIDRKTVKAILDSNEVTFSYSPRKHQDFPKLGKFKDSLKKMLQENLSLPCKRRSPYTRLYERLVEFGYRGGYDSVRRYCSSWLRDNEESFSGVGCVPMSFGLAEAFQFDWTPEHAVINGVTTPIHVAVMTLCYSRMTFVRAYPRETLEMVLDAHVRGFSFFEGSCERGIYDNMKTAVTKILQGKEREWQKVFDQMSSHYLYEHDACTPGEPQEKGRVERKALSLQTDYFRPSPKAESLSDLNEQLESEFLKRARMRMHPELKDRTIWEVFIEEKSSLTMVSCPFDAFVPDTRRVSSTQLIRFDRNQYSVPLSGNQIVDIRVYAEKLQVIYKGEVIAEHHRAYGRDKIITDFRHYLKALSRKPGSLRNGVPFQDENLPSTLVDLRWQMREKYDDADRQFVEVLCAVSQYGVDDVCCACELTLESGTCSKDVLMNFLYRLKDGTVHEDIEVPDNLHLREPPSDDCSAYNNLLLGEYHEQTSAGIC